MRHAILTLQQLERIEEQPYMSRYLEDFDRRIVAMRHWLLSSCYSVSKIYWTWSLSAGQFYSDSYPLWFCSASFLA